MRSFYPWGTSPICTRALRHNTCLAQDPISTHSATKRMVEILDAVYEKSDLLAIVRKNCSHLQASDREKLLSVLLKFEPLFDGTFPTACIFWIKGRYEAIPWQAILYPAQTQSRPQKRNQADVQHWRVEMATIIAMGVTNIYHTQKG